MSKTPTLKPCPFCGSTIIKPSAHTPLYVICQNCSATGPTAPRCDKEPNQSAELWNYRDYQPPQTQLTPRDIFAAAALIGVKGPTSATEAAQYAFLVADAMLIMRETIPPR